MFPLCSWKYLLFLILSVDGSLRYDEGQNDICDICSCSNDGSVVDCSRNGLTELPNSSNDFYRRVKKLNVSNNDLSKFPENLYQFYNLIELDVSYNQINYLPANGLNNLTWLEVLNLSNNDFDAWLNLNPNEVLKPAVKLNVLDLSHNKFTTLGDMKTQELFISSSLETLLLDNCNIDSIHGKSPLSGLFNIKVLNLSKNPLKRVQGLISPTLKSLDVSHCLLSYVHHNSLEYLPSLTYLQMSHNYRLVLATPTVSLLSESLRYLDISYCNVMQPSLTGFPNLRKAIVRHNMIRFLTSIEFINNTKLEYLDMSYNSIGSLKSDTLKGLSNLKYLDLSWNEIANIPENILMQTPSLSQINLSRNYLTKVGHLKSFSVTTIDMSQCEIDTIGKDSLEGLQSLVDLNLSRNLLSRIPDSISSNTLQYLNLNYNRISHVSNFTFFMLPRLTSLSVIGNRFTTIWNKSFLQSNPYLEKIDLGDNMWRCECKDGNMFELYEYLTLEPNKKEESHNLVCQTPSSLSGQSWIEACYFDWFPSEKTVTADSLVWFLMAMIVGLALCFLVVSAVRRSMKRRLEAIQEERERQVEEARERLRQIRLSVEQQAQCNAPDPRDLISPPTYDEALSMPKLNASCHSLCETGSSRTKRSRGRRKTKSSGDLLEETERNGDVPSDDLELSETRLSSRERRRRRVKKFGSHEIAELDNSPGVRRRRMSYYEHDPSESITLEVEAELERPLRSRSRRNSIDDDEPRESDF